MLVSGSSPRFAWIPAKKCGDDDGR
jgi:hypothetical protein